jgi:hypothetical protein
MLEALFRDFCDHFDNSFLWKQKGKKLTMAVLHFFSDKDVNLGNFLQKEYMQIDQVWRSEYSDIELALESQKTG